MLLLLETPAGLALFSLKNQKLLKANVDDIYEQFKSEADARRQVSLQAFSEFGDTKKAMEVATELTEGVVGKGLKKFLKKNLVDPGLGESLAVLDKTLGTSITKKLGIEVAVLSDSVKEIMRGIRMHLTQLLDGIDEKEMNSMALGLAHTLSRFKLKFSPDKVDTMIIQAVGLLDDLDKELNNFAMRLREWYGWHFPEMGKIVTENVAYAKVVKLMGFKSKAKDTEFSKVGVPDEIASEVQAAADTSMGTEITDEDLRNINTLAERVIELTEYRASLAEYLKLRMSAIAPNLTHMVGELVGARLISQAGSLMSLAKHPSSTVQILGAEKALFRALKTKKQTPKYGLIYHASLVGQSAPALKGKISRVLAAKLSLCCRVDALGDQTEPTLGKEFKEYVEKRLATLEETGMRGVSKGMKKPDQAKFKKTEAVTKSGTATYNKESDVVEEPAPKKKKKAEAAAAEEEEPPKKKKKKKEAEAEAAEEPAEEAPKKKKKKAAAEEGEAAEAEAPPKKKKKKAAAAEE
jgi:nucleolar protein 58